MLAFSVIACFFIFYKSKFHQKINNDYMSVYDTTCIKGVFIIVVFFSHFDSYVEYTASLDTFYHSLNIGQAMVTMFLFYSGFGVMESIKKSDKYVEEMPRKRVLPLLISFATVVILYALIGVLIGKKYTVLQILLSLIGWQSVGNSNWYIFDILVLYLITFAVFSLLRKVKKHNVSITVVTLVTIIFILVLKSLGKASFWYDTVLCYPAGMFYSLYRNNFEKFIISKRNGYVCSLIFSIFCTVVFLIIYLKFDITISEILSLISFTAMTVILTMKIRVSNKFLYFLGGHLFEIYTLMRIPMIIFNPYMSQGMYKYLYFILCFVITLLLSFLFKRYNVFVKRNIVKYL